jgi:hypothetical protein
VKEPNSHIQYLKLRVAEGGQRILSGFEARLAVHHLDGYEVELFVGQAQGDVHHRVSAAHFEAVAEIFPRHKGGYGIRHAHLSRQQGRHRSVFFSAGDATAA